jgi:hypothetical protein
MSAEKKFTNWHPVQIIYILHKHSRNDRNEDWRTAGSTTSTQTFDVLLTLVDLVDTSEGDLCELLQGHHVDGRSDGLLAPRLRALAQLPEFRVSPRSNFFLIAKRFVIKRQIYPQSENTLQQR